MEAGSTQGGAAAVGADPFAAMAAQLTPKRAVSYIRVSTREQAQRGGSEEGFSLPAQREANKRKAQSMGALVVKEFADRGESARSANRPELQKMLAYLKEDGGIDYVIVHKLDRLARNRADDVEITGLRGRRRAAGVDVGEHRPDAGRDAAAWHHEQHRRVLLTELGQ